MIDPHSVLGIELNEYSTEQARVAVWIGELQWRLRLGHGLHTDPVLQPLDHIECRVGRTRCAAGSRRLGRQVSLSARGDSIHTALPIRLCCPWLARPAYGWAGWSPTMPGDEILRRLLALNRERAGR